MLIQTCVHAWELRRTGKTCTRICYTDVQVEQSLCCLQILKGIFGDDGDVWIKIQKLYYGLFLSGLGKYSI